jgi:hypothetical protein
MFEKYQVDVKNIKCPSEWWGNMSLCFQLLHFLPVKFLTLWDPKYKLKGYFHWLEYLQICQDVTCNQIFS